MDDYYIRCAEIILYRNNYVMRCLKCETLFLALSSFTSHYDSQHRRSEACVSPDSKVYINLAGDNNNFSAYNYTQEVNKPVIEARPDTPTANFDNVVENDTESKIVFEVKEAQHRLDNWRTCRNLLRTNESSDPIAIETSPSQDIVEAEESYEGDIISLCTSEYYENNETVDEHKMQNRKRNRRRFLWNADERNAIKNYFGDLGKMERLPTLVQCWDAIQKYPVLSNRTGPQVKTWIDNQRRYKLGLH